MGAGIVRVNPCRDVRLPTIPKRDMLTLTAAELHALAEAMPTLHDRLAVLVAGYGGLRASELWALRRMDVDLQGRLHVRRALKTADGAEIGATKNGKPRTIALPRFLRALLNEHLASPLPRGNGPEALLFASPAGGVVRHTLWVRTVFRPAVKATLPTKAGLRFHDLRHTCASLLIAAGQHPKVIQERLGHASITTTLDRYGHLLEGLDEAAADALDAAYTLAATPTNNVTALPAALRE